MTTLIESKEIFKKECEKKLADLMKQHPNDSKKWTFKSTKIVLENRTSKNVIIQKLSFVLIKLIEMIFVSRVNNLGMTEPLYKITSGFLSKIPDTIRIIALHCDSYEIYSMDFDSPNVKVQFEYWKQLDANRPKNRHYELEYTLRERTRTDSRNDVAIEEEYDFQLPE